MPDIIKRGNIYYFHKRKPDDIKHLLEGNGSHRTFSLKTSDMKVAKQKAKEELDRWQSLKAAKEPTEMKPSTSPITTKDLQALETRYRLRVQKRIERFEKVLGRRRRTLVRIEKALSLQIKKLGAMLGVGSFFMDQLRTNPAPLLAKYSLYEECLIASERDSLDMSNIRRVARRVMAILIESGTQIQKMIEDEIYESTTLTEIQRHIRKKNEKKHLEPLAPSQAQPAISDTATDKAPLLSEMFEESILKGKRTEKTIETMRSSVNLLIDWCGSDKSIADYSRSDLRDFRDNCLMQLPKNHTQVEKWKKMDLRSRCEAKKPHNAKISPKTVNNHLAYICSVFSYAHNEHYIPRNPATKLDVQEQKDINRAYTTDELKALRNNLTLVPKKPSHYWSVLFAMYQGMRLNEICQLHTDDIYKDADGVEVIDINDSGVKKLKNKSSERIIPIHPTLIKLGLLDFVNTRRKELKGKTGLLFCDVKVDKYGSYIRRTSHWFNNTYKPSLFHKEDGDQGYHSLRHSFIQQCQNQAKMDDRINQEITGHKSNVISDVHKGYAGKLTPGNMLEQLKRLKYELD